MLSDQLVLGTRNRKKAQELIELLEPVGFRLLTLAELHNSIEVDEDGSTFAENAAIKATRQARHLDLWVIGEDSGLSVDALHGSPGVFSARFSGVGATDESNNRLLLERLGDATIEKRAAHYTCHIALSDPAGTIRISSESHCHGRIRFEPVGSMGFGYDPLFEIVEYHRTFGELGSSVKSVISHRARALRQFIPKLIEPRNAAPLT